MSTFKPTSLRTACISGLLVLLSVVFVQAQVRFSVYMAPRMSAAEGETLKITEDLHYAIGERNVPLYLKEGRQSMEYPWTGGNELSLFRLEEGPQGQVRVPVASTRIPAGVRRGVLILVPKEEKIGIVPFWLDPRQEEDGTAVVCNMSGKTVGLRMDDGKGVSLVPKKRYVFQGKFNGDDEFAYHKLEAFLKREREGREDRMVKVLSRNVPVPKKDAVVLLLLPKQGDYLSITTLSPHGIDDPIRREELERLLSQVKTPAEG